MVWGKSKSDAVAVDHSSILFQSVNNVQGGNCPSSSVFSEGQAISDHLFQEITDVTSHTIMDMERYSFNSSSAGQPSDGSVSDIGDSKFLWSWFGCFLCRWFACLLSCFSFACHNFDYKIYYFKRLTNNNQ